MVRMVLGPVLREHLAPRPIKRMDIVAAIDRIAAIRGTDQLLDLLRLGNHPVVIAQDRFPILDKLPRSAVAELPRADGDAGARAGRNRLLGPSRRQSG